jgi:RNA polymerase sigma-70 factor (ECF subfamily)
MNKLLIEELLGRIASDDDMTAYEKLYHLLFPSLFSISFSILQNKEASEEIVSDVFLKIWNSRQKLVQLDAVLMYIFRITKNAALTEQDRQRKNKLVDISSVNDEVFLRFEDPEQKLISSEMQAGLNAAIHSLPPQCQTIFHLVKEEGLKYREVAEILDLSVNTVRNQLAIAVKKLYEQLSKNNF